MISGIYRAPNNRIRKRVKVMIEMSLKRAVILLASNIGKKYRIQLLIAYPV